MSTPALNPRYAKNHAVRARTVGYTAPGRPARRRELLTFIRGSSVYFNHLRRSYTDTEWGLLLRSSLEGTKFREVLDKVFSVESTP